jgi:hypothetical protein
MPNRAAHVAAQTSRMFPGVSTICPGALSVTLFAASRKTRPAIQSGCLRANNSVVSPPMDDATST